MPALPRPRRSRLRVLLTGLVAALLLWPAAAYAMVAPFPGNYTGMGFDQCDAPSNHAMDKWRTNSKYQAIGIYISGDMRACQTQANLTPAWVDHQVANGWHLVPLTVGRQAACGRYADKPGAELISRNRDDTYAVARKQGRIEARTAVAAAQALGIGRGSTLFNDMESWPTKDHPYCNRSVMWFLSAWSNQLHALHYLSGVYSSAATGLTQLDNVRKDKPATFVLPDYIWIGEWNGEKNTDSDYIDPSGWDDRQRIHQYKGGHNETHGGVTINIDSDWLDVRVRDVPPAVPNADRLTPVAGGPPQCLPRSWATTDRVGGVDRYDTAREIALDLAGGTAAPSMVLASGQAYADALSAGFLAQRLGHRAGILLTRAGSLPQATIAALGDLKTQTVYVVGGTAAVSPGVVAQLRAVLGPDGQVIRIGGANRYATNRHVTEQAMELGDDPVGSTTLTAGQGPRVTALLATGQGFADAIAASPATHGNGTGALPLVLTKSDRLTPSARAQLSDLGIEQVIVVGGDQAISPTVERKLTDLGIAVTRLAGENRYDTATMVADLEVAPASPTTGQNGGLGFDKPGCGRQTAYLANGKKFADALAGGPRAGDNTPAPILLTRPHALAPRTETWMEQNDQAYGRITALGGLDSVDTDTLGEARRAIG